MLCIDWELKKTLNYPKADTEKRSILWQKIKELEEVAITIFYIYES